MATNYSYSVLLVKNFETFINICGFLEGVVRLNYLINKLWFALLDAQSLEIKKDHWFYTFSFVS